MNNRPKAIMYVRCSSEGQQRYSSADQISAEESSDATVVSRPALKRLLKHIERSRGRVAGLIVDDASRLVRHIDYLSVGLAKER